MGDRSGADATRRDGLPLRPPADETVRVLHVEDDGQFAEMVATFLERERSSFSVTTETDPRDALDRLADRRFDCVVSDYDMPEIDGLELLERVRADHPDLPFVLFTGQGSESIAGEAISAGVTDYLQKGGGTEKYAVLANRIDNAVEAYRARRQVDRSFRAIERAHDGISLLDEDGEFVYCNRAYADIVGYDRDQLVGEHWSLLYREEDVHEIRESILPAARESTWTGETVLRRRDGETVVVEHTLTYSEDGSLVCTISEATADLERTLSLRERAMDEAPVGIVITDPDREDNPIVYANERFEALTGYDRAEILGRNCRFLQGEDTDEAPVAELRRAIDAGESTVVELRNYRKDGEQFWNRVWVAPLYEDDEVTNWVGFQEDVTDRREREQRLRTASARLEALFDRSPDMIDIHDPEGRIVDVNPRLCEELGYDREQLIGMSVWEIDDAIDPETATSMWADMSTGDAKRIEGEYRRSDGSTVPVEVHLRRLDIEGEDRFLAISRDVTDQRAYERELEAQNERLEEFASVVAHDLRNPLERLGGYLELAAETGDPDYFRECRDAATRMEELIDDLLTLARAGEGIDDTEAVDLSAVARECWGTVSTGRGRLRVETDRIVEANRSRLRQLLENLVRNSVEHSSTGPRSSTEDSVEHSSTGPRTESGDSVEHGSIGSRSGTEDRPDAGDDRDDDPGDRTVTVTVGDTEDGFYVADDGPGIPPEDRDRVFETGYSTNRDGTGFGLNIVRQIAEAHGWTVTLTESAGGGARFEFGGVTFREPSER